MLVFSTRLPLRNDVTQEECLQVFIDWIIESPHYPITQIDYDISSHKDFDYKEKNITVSFRHFMNEEIEVSACRLINEEENAVWYNDCIFLVENDTKSLLVQLNCGRKNYNSPLPQIHKPYIVRKFVERGLCRDDAGIPVTDSPLGVESGYYTTCVEIMQGKHAYTMPAVYISCDYWNQTVISPEFLANQLSGVAHVFFEQNYETALRLKKDTDGNNAYTGYIGIYFPGTKYCQKHSITYYRDYKELTREISSSVWGALTNRADALAYSWNQIVALQARQKMGKWRDISEQNKAQLDEYMQSFDQENKELRAQNEELNKQLFATRSRLDALLVSANVSDADACFYKMGNVPNLYPSERNDLLHSILSQVQNRYDQGSRAYALIEALLEANPKDGECERIVQGVRTILGAGGQLTKAQKADLKSLGFTIEDGGTHYKMYFHDPQYMFTVAKTPSDHREGKNLVSDICKIIDIERNI